MSVQSQNDVFADVVNDMMKELHTLSKHYRTDIIHRLIVNNVNSPILAEIQHLSLSMFNIDQIAAVFPTLGKMTNLVSLALAYCTVSPDQLKFLFTGCPALSKLQSLDLSEVKELKSEDFLLLSQSTTLTNLTSLNLESICAWGSRDRALHGAVRGDGIAGFGRFGCTTADEDESANDSTGLIALLSSPVVKNLTHLNLGYVTDDPLVHTTIATSPYLSNLVSLDLARNNITPNAVAALAASTTLANITHLNLAHNNLDDALLAQLFSPPSLLATNLQSLDISINYNGTSISSLQWLQKACPHLTQLNLGGNNELGPAGVAFIATHMPNLTKLNLTCCKIGDKGYAALAGSTALVNLRELYLSSNRADSQSYESIIALINSPTMANLTRLELDDTHRGPQVLTAIAKSPAMSKLQRLNLSNTAVGDGGVIALSQSTTLTNLTSLDLRANGIGPAGVNALCTSPVVSKLTSLDLACNYKIGNSIATALAAPSSTLYSLATLGLLGVSMDKDDLLQLLASPNLDQLDILRISGITSVSTKALYRARFGLFY